MDKIINLLKTGITSIKGNLHTGKGNLQTRYNFRWVIYKFQTVCKLPSNAIRILYRL